MQSEDTSLATKILWSQIAFVSLVVLLFVSAAPRWVAFRLGYQPRLGAPAAALLDWPVYPPRQVFLWWYWYDAYVPWVSSRARSSPGQGALPRSRSRS